MITRIAMFEGTLKSGNVQAFRTAVKQQLVPLWSRFAGSTEIRVLFTDECDDGAPAYPMILEISYPDTAALDRAMESPARLQLRDMIGGFLAEHFDGRVHHHTAELNVFVPVSG